MQPASVAAPIASEPPATLQQLTECAELLSTRAKELWPNAPDPRDAQPTTDGQRRALGYLNLGRALELACEIIHVRGSDTRAFRAELHEVLRLMAEAQNAVRVEHEGSHLGGEQPEQRVVFRWLRYITDEAVEAFRIERFMRLGDAADPANSPSVARRLAEFTDRWKQSRRADELWSLLSSHLNRVSAADVDPLDAWKAIDAVVAELIQSGVRPSDKTLRGLLLPVADAIPEELADSSDDEDRSSSLSSELEQVLAEIQKFLTLEARTSAVEFPVDVPDEDTLAVREVRGLWSGKVLAMVGGVARPHAATRLQKAFDLEDVRWISATKRDRVSNLAHQLKDVDLLVLITALMGHKHNDLREACRMRGIPFVQLKQQSGYGVNTVAEAIVAQST